MSTALKTKDSSVLDEFEIPEHLGGVVEDLRKEKQTLDKEIKETKAAPVVRKQDESTRVFNLRQHQMELKLQELEEKKKKTEEELSVVLKEKNSKLHDDLRKVAQYILQETKKFAPLEKELEEKISSIANLRNELKQIFESNLGDRKKNFSLLEDQNKQLHALGDQIRENSKILQADFHILTTDIERLQRERQDETKKLSDLKIDIAQNEGIYHTLEVKKSELRELDHKISLGEKNAMTFAKLDEELVILKNEVARLYEEKNRLHEVTGRLQHDEVHAQEALARLKLQEKNFETVIAARKNQVQLLETDILDVRKRLEILKNDEHEVHTRYLQECERLRSAHFESARLEGLRDAQVKLLDEATAMFEEKRAFFQRELTSLQAFHDSREAELVAQMELKKARWDEEFHAYCEARKSALKLELDAIDKVDLEEIRRKKKVLLTEVEKVMNSIFSGDGFSSTDERTERARKEVEKSFHLIFGKTRRWLFW
jgi:hypothetical protein